MTYCTNKELAFDYLRDRLVIGQRGSNLHLKLESVRDAKPRTAEFRLRGLHFAIVDEADSVLVDEARTPLIISKEERTLVSPEVAREALALAVELREGFDFHLVAEQRRVILLPAGRDAVARFADGRGPGWRGVVVREELARQALSAVRNFHNGEQYIVRDGKVQIVDEHTGRVMPDRSWSDGLHQMIGQGRLQAVRSAHHHRADDLPAVLQALPASFRYDGNRTPGRQRDVVGLSPSRG